MAGGDISIVEADPDLGELLDPGELERARREARARLQRLSPGEWDAAAALEHDAHHRGFLIVDGLLSRTVEVLGRRCVELLGHGDVMRPWQWDDEGSHVRAEVGWIVLEPTRARGARPRPRPAHGAVAAARRRAVQPRHPPRPPPRGRARDRPPPARRRPAAADALAPRRALGPRPHRRRRRPAAAQPPAARGPRRRPPPVGHDRDGRARARRRSISRRESGEWVLHGARRRSCATTGWWPRSPEDRRGGAARRRPLRPSTVRSAEQVIEHAAHHRGACRRRRDALEPVAHQDRVRCADRGADREATGGR